jgi:hypothetical protein
MAKSARQNVMDKLKKFGGHIEVTKTNDEFIIEAIAPYDKYWRGNGQHAIVASVPRGTYTMDAWQKIHTVMKEGVAHCKFHCTESEECEYSLFQNL